MTAHPTSSTPSSPASDTPPHAADAPPGRAIRTVADRYVQRMAELDPTYATFLGLPGSEDRLADLSPAGRAAWDELSTRTLAELTATERRPDVAGGVPDVERRCGRLLRERLEADLATSVDDEYLREVVNAFGLQERLQGIFLQMPLATEDDWHQVAQRLRALPATVAGFRTSLHDSARRDAFRAAPRQVEVVAAQLGELVAGGAGHGWYAGLCADARVSPHLAAELESAAAEATAATAALRDWLRHEYAPMVAATADGVGPDRYAAWARYWNGADLDLRETYEWGWAEYQRVRAEMLAEVERILPGCGTRDAMDHLNAHGPAATSPDELRGRLQELMDRTIDELDGTHFDLPAPVRTIDVALAPAGSAAAVYYVGPSQGFRRPGRVMVPSMGRDRFPLWPYWSVSFHEGAPGHHLQLGLWVSLADELSLYQTSVGDIDACKEGWALYAEHLMDELGYYQEPGTRLGFLDWQMVRAIRVVVDVGLHLGLSVPADSPLGAGQPWSPEIARQFVGAHSGQPPEYVASEIDRYLGLPGQAISYKLGERAWMRGLAAARAAHERRGEELDLRSWHMQALSMGSMGLDDLADELGRLGGPRPAHESLVDGVASR